MKVSTENDNNFGYEKITIVVDNIPLSNIFFFKRSCVHFFFIIISDAICLGVNP